MKYCEELLAEHPIRQVILVSRAKTLAIGELQVDLSCFISIINSFLESRGISVIRLGAKDAALPARRGIVAFIKQQIRNLVQFCRWKWVTIGRPKDYSHILINPAYNNKINFAAPYIFPGARLPQAFFRYGWPFFHDLSAIFRCGWQWHRESKVASVEKQPLRSYRMTVEECNFDIGDIFAATIVKYLGDIVSARRRVEIFWQNCPRVNEVKRIIFSFSPVFMYAYYFIDKMKRSEGQVVVSQHGGLYGYADHFLRYILDYKLADVFLSYGKSHASAQPNMAGESCDQNHPVGTIAVFEKRPRRLPRGKNTAGVYFLMGTLTNYFQSAMKWNGSAQFKNVKAVVNLFRGGRYGALSVKGVKNHEMHSQVAEFIRDGRAPFVDYSVGDMRRVLAKNPRFIIIDGVATTLLELVANYQGLIFVLNCQETWQIHPAALALLKQRVFYAENADELEQHLQKNLLRDNANTRADNNLFQNHYIKHFSYEAYRKGLETNS